MLVKQGEIMVGQPDQSQLQEESLPTPHITFFEVKGLFGGRRNHHIAFPSPLGVAPSVLILAGLNGSGKTTILNMIAGMLQLNFDEFRRVPFVDAKMGFSEGSTLRVKKTDQEDFPLLVEWKEYSIQLGPTREFTYDPIHRATIAAFRKDAKTSIGAINIELLSIHRSSALRDAAPEETKLVTLSPAGKVVRAEPSPASKKPIANRVREFMRDAQLDYRPFFSAEELELLPRMIKRVRSVTESSTPEVLLGRVEDVEKRSEKTRRFGLRSDTADLNNLRQILTSPGEALNSYALTIIETYVETQENRQKARELIASRLWKFEEIMDEFLQEKRIRIDARSGILISTNTNQDIDETALSSGEYHFLYMMVSALLCKRVGSVIAIDEPELSLHVSWQRKIISALTKCAEGALPLFLFATHSMSIAAEHRSSIYELSPMD